jgi:glycosyltransferase involved in cell wall biosynthesis
MVDNAIPHEARPFDKQLSTYFFKQCNAFFTLSESVSHDLEMLVPGRPSATSPHPIYDTFGEAVSREEGLAKLNLDPNEKYILFFGFVRKYKGLDLLIEAMGRDEVKKLGVKLIVAGEFYDAKTDYIDQIERLGLKDSVIIRDDFIPQDEVKQYFCGADLAAQTYRSATQSGVTQIAYHFDKPMLVTNVGGLSEIVPNGKVGFVVNPNPKAIAAAIVRYFEENLETLFTENTRNRKKLFSWKHFTHTFLNFAKQIDAKS